VKPTLYRRIREILEAARTGVARSVNTAQVVANWLIGREIVVEEQKGKWRAEYGEQLLTDLAGKLKADGIPGYSVQNLRYMRQFFLAYPALAGRGGIRHAVRGELTEAARISDALPRKSRKASIAEGLSIHHAPRGESPATLLPEAIRHTLCDES
jgi:hypothetical protein